MSRRKAREMALQVLFQLDFNESDAGDALTGVFEEAGETNAKTKLYAQNLVAGTQQHMADIDAIISGQSLEWKLDRMASVDRNIARLAIYEMKFAPEDVPPNVVINEAVELAKTFGTEESGRFVNGILGALVKNKG